MADERYWLRRYQTYKERVESRGGTFDLTLKQFLWLWTLSDFRGRYVMICTSKNNVWTIDTVRIARGTFSGHTHSSRTRDLMSANSGNKRALDDPMSDPWYRKYRQHEKNAESRGILFYLTFEEWSRIWIDSGHMHERGNRPGKYVMARYGDLGAYEIGNVRVIRLEENTSEAKAGERHHQYGKPHPMRGKNLSPEACDNMRVGARRRIENEHATGQPRKRDSCGRFA